MSETPPLDLRTLADVDSPELVSAALARFRRRAFWSVALMVLIGALIVLALLFFGPKGPRAHVLSTGGVATIGVFQVDAATIVLVRGRSRWRHRGPSVRGGRTGLRRDRSHPEGGGP